MTDKKMPTPSVNDTQTIRPRRVFSCVREKRLMMRSEVWKDHNNNYRCSYCTDPVEDVTNTVTGHDFLEVLGIW